MGGALRPIVAPQWFNRQDMIEEKRGSTLLKRLDRYVGGFLSAILAVLLRVKDLKRSAVEPGSNSYLVICLGAIGDLIILTEAVELELTGKRVFLACSNANFLCAEMYTDVYAGIDIVDVKSPLDVHRISRKHNVDAIYDSTQWANIGPLQVGLARLLCGRLRTTGFATDSLARNALYSQTVPHIAELHEIANFINLLSGRVVLRSNESLGGLLPDRYQRQPHQVTRRVLFHPWPAGSRSYLKEWPQDYWIELAKYFDSIGYEVFLSGAPGDRPRNDVLIARAGIPSLVNIAGDFTLTELRSFVRDEIECAISVNTGTMHLVASTGIPVIGLHGPTNPARWGPLGANSIALLPENGNCAYLNYGFEYPEDDEEAYALDRLTVSQVVEAFWGLMQFRE